MLKLVILTYATTMKEQFIVLSRFKAVDGDLLDTRIHEAVENDPSHTKNLSK